MGERMYGYVRVSAKDQNEARQMDALRQYGVERKNIYVDKQSGKTFDRPQYSLLMRRMKAGDSLVIKSIDRLGRNYEEILRQWRRITKEKGVNIVVLDIPLLNTACEKDLTTILITDLVLQILSYVAQAEREMIHQRQVEGIACARARGVKFGPKPKRRPIEYAACAAAWENGSMSARAAARKLGISHKTFLRWVRSG